MVRKDQASSTDVRSENPQNAGRYLLPPRPNFTIGLLKDESGSFDKEVEDISEDMFTPIKAFYERRPGCENLLVGFVTNSSNKTLDRYIDIPTIAYPESGKNNPWIESENKSSKDSLNKLNEAIQKENNNDWRQFIIKLNGVVSKPATTTSDVLNAYNRLLIALNENPEAKSYLLLSTDFKDTYHKTKNLFAKIPSNVIVIIVGAQKDVPLVQEKKQEGFMRFESLMAALNFIINSN
jgi:hypothetical protein